MCLLQVSFSNVAFIRIFVTIFSNWIRSSLAGVTSIEDLEALAAPLKTATKTLAARAAEAGLDTAAMGILDGSKFIPLDALVDEKVQFPILIHR